MLLFCISIKIDHIKIFDLKPKTTNNLQQNSQYILLQYETVKHNFLLRKVIHTAFVASATNVLFLLLLLLLT